MLYLASYVLFSIVVYLVISYHLYCWSTRWHSGDGDKTLESTGSLCRNLSEQKTTPSNPDKNAMVKLDASEHTTLITALGLRLLGS